MTFATITEALAPHFAAADADQLVRIEGRPVVWVRHEREMDDGTKVEAFLSHRQHSVESQARGRFAKEIKVHLAI